MANLAQETVRLLDRLFNLKGEENLIINGIEERIKETKGQIEDEEQARVQNDVARIDCEGKLNIFNTQRQIFESAFGELDNNTFSALRDIGVNVEIGTMLETIAAEAPLYCERIEKQIRDYKDAIEANKSKKDSLSDELRDLESSREQSIEDRKKLVSLLEQSLSDSDMERESLSASYVKKILSLFGLFSEEEISTLTKLIIFPDDGLYDYNDSYDERLRSGLIHLFPEEVSEDELTPGDDYEKDGEALASEGDSLIVQNFGEAHDIEKGLGGGEEPEVGDGHELEITSLRKDEEAALVPAADAYGERGLAPVEEKSSDESKYQDIFSNRGDHAMEGETTLLDLSRLNARLEDEERREIVAPIGESREDEVVTLTSESGENDKLKFGDLGAPSGEKSKLEENSSSYEEKQEENVEDYLTSIGLDVANFAQYNSEQSKEEILKLFEDVDHKIIQDNYELLRSINASEEAIYKCVLVHDENHLYVIDKDLSKKITALRAKGLHDHVAKRLVEDANSGLRESLTTLEDRMAAIESSVGKIGEENIGLIGTDIVLYDQNCKELASFGLELDEQELRNNRGILMLSKNVPEDLDVLKSYLISLVRKNGKYALTPFWKPQYDLLTDIDDLIEADLDGLFEGTPEVLGLTASEVIQRYRYCKEKNIPTHDEEGNFYDYIVDYTKFDEKFGIVNFASLEARDAVNDSLPYVVGNEGYVEILTTILKNYYNGDENLVTVRADADVESYFEEMKAKLFEKFHVEQMGKYTYRIEDVSISKNKFERHLIVLLNALAGSGQIDEVETGVAREVLLTALLYNLRQDYDTLKKVAESGLGFKVNAKTLGGTN